MMLEDRRLAVLRAIVEDYVTTHEPVGSKALVERHNLGVSPATIRNDMAALEDEGYISQPHTSAGRIPTDLGYRHFVDRIASVKPLSAPERRAMESFLADAVDLDDVMGRTVRLLAQLTRQVAMVQYPSLTRSRVKHVELILLGDNRQLESRLMMVLIVDSGRVEQRMIDCAGPVDSAVLADLQARLNSVLADQPFSSVPEALASFDERFTEADRPMVRAVLGAVVETVTGRLEERVVLGGTSHLASYQTAFPMAIQPVLEALEEQVVLLRLLGSTAIDETITVRIGHENPISGLESTSVVTARYAHADQPVAALGVVGPTHMDYRGTMGTVQAVAQYIGHFLSEQ